MSDYVWSDDAEKAARAVLARYPQKRSALMPLLYIAMNEDGYLTEDGMRRVAELVDVTPAQVQSVASFYTMYKREPVGDYLVSVCTSISCWLLGADDVLHAAEEEAGAPAGALTNDEVLSVEHVECIGACGGAPAVQVNYETIEGVTPEKGVELIKWLRTARPKVINCDEMQALFGGDKAFDWAVTETDGATGPHPAFPAYGNVGSVGKKTDS